MPAFEAGSTGTPGSARRPLRSPYGLRWLVRAVLAASAFAIALPGDLLGQSSVVPPSPVITGISFDLATLRESAPGSDNWVITWAEDGHQYTSWGDGGGFGGSNSSGRVSMGVARIEGPRDAYTGRNVWGGQDPENPASFGGKSYGIISIDGVMYMWRTGDGSEGSAFDVQDLYKSVDHSASWTATGVAFKPSDFPSSKGFFAPTFLQFGEDYHGARDGYVYVYAPENKGDGWEVQKPGEIALLRVPKGQLEARERYEYFSGRDGSGAPTWTSSLEKRAPVFEDPANGVMRTSVSYNAPLGRYLLMTQQVSRYASQNYHLGIYDAPEPWGPWTAVFFGNPRDDLAPSLSTGSKTVFFNFSNKWLSADGRSFVLVYTGAGSDSLGTVEGAFEIADGSYVKDSRAE